MQPGASVLVEHSSSSLSLISCSSLFSSLFFLLLLECFPFCHLSLAPRSRVLYCSPLTLIYLYPPAFISPSNYISDFTKPLSFASSAPSPLTPFNLLLHPLILFQYHIPPTPSPSSSSYSLSSCCSFSFHSSSSLTSSLFISSFSFSSLIRQHTLIHNP